MTTEFTHATSADQDQLALFCHLIMASTVCFSVSIFLWIFPLQMMNGLLQIKRLKVIYWMSRKSLYWFYHDKIHIHVTNYKSKVKSDEFVSLFELGLTAVDAFVCRFNE
jgi:hypothetical protein